MSVKVSIQQVQDRLPEPLQHIAVNGEEYVVERNGQECALIVSARDWKRRRAAERLDALGDRYRLSSVKQSRVEALLELQKQRKLSAAQSRELKRLLRECDAVLLRRASALARWK